MYETVENLKNDLKRFISPLKGQKELEALFPYVQSSQIILCASGQGPYNASKTCWFILTDLYVFIVLKASMMGTPSVIALSLLDIDAAIENRGLLLSKLTLTSKGSIYTLHNAQKNDTTEFVKFFNKRKSELLNSAMSVSAPSIETYPAMSSQLIEQNTKSDKKKPGCMARILQVFFLLIVASVLAGKFTDKDNTKSNNAANPEHAQTKNAIQDTAKIITPSRKKGTKAFVKNDGVKIFKEAELKNSFGELMRGTEVRIQEGLSSSGDLPVRYKVNVMKSGKVDIVGWLIEDALSNPVNLVAQQEKSTNSKKSTSRHLLLNDFIYRFNTAASSLRDGHNISKQDMIFNVGSVNDSYMKTYADCLVLLLIVEHDTDNFVQGCVLYGGDRTGSYSDHAILLMGELFYAAGVINNISETVTILNRLGFSNLKDGDLNSIIINGWKAYLSYSSEIFGVMCGVEEP